MPDPAEVARLTTEAEAVFGPGMATRVKQAVVEYGLILVAMALSLLRDRAKKLGKKPVQSWGWVLGTLANLRQEGPAPSRPSDSSSGTVRSLLERLTAEGWILRPDGKGGVMKFKCRGSAVEWDCLGSDLKAEMMRRQDEIRIHVLGAVGGTSCPSPSDPRASPS